MESLWGMSRPLLSRTKQPTLVLFDESHTRSFRCLWVRCVVVMPMLPSLLMSTIGTVTVLSLNSLSLTQIPSHLLKFPLTHSNSQILSLAQIPSHSLNLPLTHSNSFSRISLLLLGSHDLIGSFQTTTNDIQVPYTLFFFLNQHNKPLS